MGAAGYLFHLFFSIAGFLFLAVITNDAWMKRQMGWTLFYVALSVWQGVIMIRLLSL